MNINWIGCNFFKTKVEQEQKIAASEGALKNYDYLNHAKMYDTSKSKF